MFVPPPPIVVQVPPPRRTPRGALVVLVVLAILVAGLAGMLAAREMAAPTGVVLEPVATAGTNPFMPSVGTDAVDVRPVAHTGGRYAGTTPGLFGGTGDDAACDRGALSRFLDANPDRAAGWASVLGLRDASSTTISRYVDGLTAVVLRSDTFVTNHGWNGGRVTSWPAVLQAGTAVLVDEYGNPVTRCSCGNPLTAPRSFSSVAYHGPRWYSFRSTSITVIQHQTTTVTNDYTVVDVHTGEAQDRPTGTAGEADTANTTVTEEFPPALGPVSELGETGTEAPAATSSDPPLQPGSSTGTVPPGTGTSDTGTSGAAEPPTTSTTTSTTASATGATSVADLAGRWTASRYCDLGPSNLVFDGAGGYSVGTSTTTAGSYDVAGGDIVLSPPGAQSAITFAPDDAAGTSWTDTEVPTCTLTRTSS